ncbi:MAG: chemotaxis protein [Vicingaceae bacterium]
MSVFNKVKWVLGVLGVFLLVFATNRIDKNNFKRVEESVDNIYNDRLLAKELLLEVSLKFHNKELAYSLNDSSYLKEKNDLVNAQITDILKTFDRVEATEKEERILTKLNRNHKKLIALEENLASNDTLYTGKCAQLFSDINANIKALASEQVNEGKQQKFLAREALASVELFSQIEIYILIILGLLIQIIILYNPKKS